MLIKTPHLHNLKMDSLYLIKLNKDTESDCLTTLESSETPTLNDSESLTIRALEAV